MSRDFMRQARRAGPQRGSSPTRQPRHIARPQVSGGAADADPDGLLVTFGSDS